MYKIYADDTLIYDSTIENFKIGKGVVTIETNKSGSFIFSVYPDHFYYDNFVRLKTVITAYKSDKIIFRGRILNDVTDYWNNKVITCEGELGFLQDSIIRPFEFNGTPEDLFIKFIQEHNSQVDEFKKFKIGVITVKDENDYIVRSNSDYESSLTNLMGKLVEESLGGYIHITHGDDNTDPTPTINYLADFTKISSQEIKFGSNLTDYTKTVNAGEIATAIIPLGAEVESEDENTENKKLTIADINDGKDYVYSEDAVNLYGWIFKTVEWEDVTVASNLKNKAEKYLANIINQNVTIELNAIDLHLLDNSIESITVGDYVRVTSEPHNFASTLLCQKQTIDLLRPDNDSITLGYTYSTFTENTVKKNMDPSGLGGIKTTVIALNNKTVSLTKDTNDLKTTTDNLKTVTEELKTTTDDLKTENDELKTDINNLKTSSERLEEAITGYVDPKGQLPQILAKSFGFFQSVEVLSDGSSVFYMHNKPTLEDSSTIWKLTGDAFAVSTDGGATWNAGMDSDGNTVVNLLSAMGIIADWVKIGGQTDGILDVKDSTGATIVRLSKEGITLADGASLISNTGVCGDLTFVSNGGTPAWLGYNPEALYDMGPVPSTLLLTADIPENFVVKKATLTVMTTATNWYYEDWLTETSDNFWGYPRAIGVYVGDSMAYRSATYMGRYDDISMSTGDRVISGDFVLAGAVGSPDYNAKKLVSGDISSYIKNGLNTFLITNVDEDGGLSESEALRGTGTAVAILSVKGYTKN